MSDWFDKPIYHVDGEIVSPKQLIKLASKLDEAFDNSVIKCTADAAKILRDEGHEVGHADTL